MRRVLTWPIWARRASSPVPHMPATKQETTGLRVPVEMSSSFLVDYGCSCHGLLPDPEQLRARKMNVKSGSDSKLGLNRDLPLMYPHKLVADGETQAGASLVPCSFGRGLD